jgi:agmatine deiminase
MKITLLFAVLFAGALHAQSTAITTPPAFPVRTMAEWEEVQAVVVMWRNHKPTIAEIVKAARPAARVVVVCTDSIECQEELTEYGVDWSSNVAFLEAPFNTIWVRDYGGSTVYRNAVDSLQWVDWIYNRWRALDNAFAGPLASYFGLPLYGTSEAPYDLVNTGGNFVTDGLGLAFASKLVLTDNDSLNVFGQSFHSEAGVDSIMKAFMGIDRYVKLPKLTFEANNHLDMYFKLLDESTLLVGQYPANIADGPQIEANLQYVLSQVTTSFGTPFRVVRVAMPPNASGFYPNAGAWYYTYVNAPFVNRRILVPTYNFPAYDSAALDVWRQAMPGYEVVGVNSTQLITERGAVHCVTKEVGVPDPLWIAHRRVDDVLSGAAAAVDAWIRHRSGVASARVFYRTDTTAAYAAVEMTLASPDSNRWTATLPAAPDGATVYYYLQAEANSGKAATRPLPAPAAYFSFRTGVSATQDAPETVARLAAVYPNPAADLTCIELAAPHSEAATLRLCNVFGQTVRTVFDGRLPAGTSHHFFDAATLRAGVYFVVLETRQCRSTGRVLVR